MKRFEMEQLLTESFLSKVIAVDTSFWEIWVRPNFFLINSIKSNFLELFGKYKGGTFQPFSFPFMKSEY